MKKFCLALFMFVIVWTLGIWSCGFPWNYVRISMADDNSDASSRDAGDSKKKSKWSDKEDEYEIKERMGSVGWSFSFTGNFLTKDAPSTFPVSLGFWITKFNPLLISLEGGIRLSSDKNMSINGGANVYFSPYKSHIYVGAGFYDNILRFQENKDIGENVMGVKTSLLVLDYLKEGLGFYAYFLPYGKYTDNLIVLNAIEPEHKNSDTVIGYGFGLMWLLR